MKRPRGLPSHTCAPKGWRGTPVISGDYDLDATIMHRKNRDMAAKIEQHLAPRPAYGQLTAYNGYHGYHGDN